MNNKFKILTWCAFGTLLFLPGHTPRVLAQEIKSKDITSQKLQKPQIKLTTNSLTVHKGTYRPIVNLWKKQMNAAGTKGHVWIGAINGNGVPDSLHYGGKRHTIIYVPSQYDRNKPAQVLIWLHGHNGFNKFQIRVLRHIKSRYERGDNVLVIAVEQPWSHWTKTKTSRNGTGPFRKSGEFEAWMSSTLDILRSFNVPIEDISSRNITLYGHSAGGSGIKSMALSGALEILKPGKIVFSDSTYGRWFDVVYDKFLVKNPNTQVFVLTKKYGAPWRSMVRFYKERKNVSQNIRHIALSRGWSHKRIGDNCLLYPDNPF